MASVPGYSILQARINPGMDSHVHVRLGCGKTKVITFGPGFYEPEDLRYGRNLRALLPPSAPLIWEGDWKWGRIELAPTTQRPTVIAMSDKNILIGNVLHEISHSVNLSLMELSLTKKLRTGVYEATYPSLDSDRFEIIVKLVLFSREEAVGLWLEMDMHSTMARTPTSAADKPTVEHLANVVDGCQVIRVALSRDIISYADASQPEHVERCREALDRLHALGYIHRYINNRSFVMYDTYAVLVDYNFATFRGRPKDLAKERAELQFNMLCEPRPKTTLEEIE